MLRRAESALDDRVAGGARRLLQPLTALREDPDLWEHGLEGLVVLLEADDVHVFKTARPLTPVVSVAERYRITPLLSLVEPSRFFVLAIDTKDVKLLEGDRLRLRRLPQLDLPRSLVEVVGRQPAGASLQSHTHGPRQHGAATLHGHGAGHDDRDAERTKLLRRIAAAVESRVAGTRAPLVVAAVERTVADFRRIAPSLPVAASAVLGNPSDLSLPDLHDAAWDCARPLLETPAKSLLARIREERHGALASVELERILRACRQGRVEALVVAGDRPRWGLTDNTMEYVELHRHRRDFDQDLVDLAVAHALAYGAEVHLVSPDSLPEQAPIGAVFRC